MPRRMTPRRFIQRQVETVCVCYQEAPQRLQEEGTHTVSVDERTGIQALERIAPTKPMKPGRAGRSAESLNTSGMGPSA